MLKVVEVNEDVLEPFIVNWKLLVSSRAYSIALQLAGQLANERWASDTLESSRFCYCINRFAGIGKMAFVN